MDWGYKRAYSEYSSSPASTSCPGHHCICLLGPLLSKLLLCSARANLLAIFVVLIPIVLADVIRSDHI